MFLNQFIPYLTNKLQFSADFSLIQNNKNCSFKLNELVDRTVFLPSGINIHFDELETMTIIDVNSGSFLNKMDKESFSFKVNFDSVDEILRQIRLRNISGIIIIDFLNMENPKNKEKIRHFILNETKKDKQKVKIGHFSMLGLFELSRERTENSIKEQIVWLNKSKK